MKTTTKRMGKRMRKNSNDAEEDDDEGLQCGQTN